MPNLQTAEPYIAAAQPYIKRVSLRRVPDLLHQTLHLPLKLSLLLINLPLGAPLLRAMGVF